MSTLLVYSLSTTWTFFSPPPPVSPLLPRPTLLPLAFIPFPSLRPMQQPAPGVYCVSCACPAREIPSSVPTTTPYRLSVISYLLPCQQYSISSSDSYILIIPCLAISELFIRWLFLIPLSPHPATSGLFPCQPFSRSFPGSQAPPPHTHTHRGWVCGMMRRSS